MVYITQYRYAKIHKVSAQLIRHRVLHGHYDLYLLKDGEKTLILKDAPFKRRLKIGRPKHKIK